MGRSGPGRGKASDIDDRAGFVRQGIAANARSAARLRAEFGSWLDRHFALSAERRADVLLAVNEAVANAAEFAYAGAGAVQSGTMDVRAAYDDASDSLAVTIDDSGRWRQRLPEPAAARHQPQIRRRGIELMRALADEVTIDRTQRGTHVRLTWTGVTRRSRA